MKKNFGFLLLAIAVGATLAITQPWTSKRGEGDAITVYCAAGIKKPVAAIAEAFESEIGGIVQLQYGGTGSLLSQIQVAKQGDLFIAADQGSLQDAKRLGVTREALELVRQYPVIATSEANPKNIQSLDDLWRDDVRVAIGNPEAASIGKITKRALGDRWPEFAEKVSVMKPTVNEIATDVKIGSVDAAIVWNSTVPQFEGLQAIRASALDTQAEIAGVAVLAASERPSAALKFARYLTAPERGTPIFKEKGFEPVPGDAWVEKPELILYSGGVNRPAIEKLLQEFATREGVDLTTVFDGCGVLCATMETMDEAVNPAFPDAYYACDTCFVPPVAGQFQKAVVLTETDIGIVTLKGNPKGLKTLADLARPGVRLGLCNAKQSTLGHMTSGMLRDSGLATSVRKNVEFESPTADMLVNQIQVGALDAAIIYRVNYQVREDKLDFFPIDHEGALATQPFSVREESPKKQLATRLLTFLQSNQEEFEKAGFIWKTEQETIDSKDIEVPDWLQPNATYLLDKDSEE